MKILEYQPRVSYYTGGGEVYPLQNAKFFSQLGHDVTILTTKANFLKESDYFKNFVLENSKIKIEYLELDDNFKYIYDEEAGVNWERWDKESLYVSRIAYKYIDSHKFDVVLVHNVIDSLAVPFNVKHVLHLHGVPSEMNYICKLILENEKNLIAVSENVRDKWKSIGVKYDMKICTNAIDEKMFEVKGDVIKDKNILFVGRLIPIKGVDYILKALKILKDRYDFKPNFTIIGKGPYREELEKLTKDLGLEESVTFKGLVTQEELINYYQTSKITVLPSFEKEGIMSTLLESAASKTPSITTMGTSMQEFAHDNENALLVRPKDEKDLSEKIYSLLTDDELRTKITNNAYNEVINNYTWLSKAKLLISMYEEFINE